METIEKQFVRAGDVLLHVVTAGPADGEPVLLLHGFPEFWYGWRKQINFLAEQGYRVIAPDQRGYNLSEKPSGIKAYRTQNMVDDAAALIEALGYQQVNLIGHDWGGVVAWLLALRYPQRLQRLMILNAPHPQVFGKQFETFNLAQISKSWYMGFFQLPAVPETILSANNYEAMERALLASANEGSFLEEDLERYKIAWSQPGALSAMLNWYRALRNGFSDESIGGETRISTPTLVLWGEQDTALEKSLAMQSLDLCEQGELVLFPNATHWLQHDKADAVNKELLQFLQKEWIKEPTV